MKEVSLEKKKLKAKWNNWLVMKISKQELLS
ncbi:hypothetical protein Godav_026681 [Gossypium davidsonii]|uniref:Uncharacterized protein n=1 Tax=Gossypium davidsonii TaxID=34287 RepID=A0A7J8RUA8_GOSDV|nr:hypothetical protein [Gossypium davidsonii]